MDGKKGEEYRSLSPLSSALHSFGISNIYFVSFRFTPLHISSIVKWRADVRLECALSFAACTQI